MQLKKIKDSYIYLIFSLVVVILNFFLLEYLNQEYMILILIFFVVFFGLPHGALDTLLAKKSNLYNNFYGFIFFNFIYLLTILIFYTLNYNLKYL